MTSGFWGKRSRTRALCALVALAGVAGGTAQVVLDGKFGASGALAGPHFIVTPDLGATRGNNLFHSFAQFNIGSGESATFSGPANIQNILTRVTGGTASSINGKLRSSIAGANLFLINPNGILFGPGATVDVSGSFAASSAHYLKLADGARFVAALDADDSGLSTAPVSAFGFLGAPAANITVQESILEAPPGKNVSLVGGNVLLDGASVQSVGGQLAIASVHGPGEVPLDLGSVNASNFRTAFPEQGEVALRNGARLDASGDRGGRVVIRGGRLVVDGASVTANTTGTGDGLGIDVAVLNDVSLANGGQINSLSTSGTGAGGSIHITAGALLLDGGGMVDEGFNPTTQISTASGDQMLGGGSAKGGDIIVKAETVELVNSAQLSSVTYGAGDAGRIEITADSVRLDALLITPTQITANSWQAVDGGKAGDIVIRARILEMRNGATLLAASFGSGRAGLVDIHADSVNLYSGSIITAGTFGAGNGGNVEITANRLNIDGKDTLSGGPDLLTGIQAITTSSESPAPGGSIHLNADSISMDRMASVFTTTYGIGPGGNVDVKAGDLTLNHGSTIRAEGLDAGRAGNISVRAERDVHLARNSAISTLAPGSSGGDIKVFAGSELTLTDSTFTAQAGLDGGNIDVGAPELVYLLRSSLTGQADTTGSGFGNGGNLLVDPASFLILTDGSLVSKSSFGNGGNISILSDYFFQSESVIDASAPFGLPGTVVVTAPQVDLSGSLVGLPGALLDAASRLRPDCGVRLAPDISSFTVLGRGGLPLQPGGFIPSPTVAPVHEQN